MVLQLVRPSEKYLQSVLKAAQEFLDSPSDFDISGVKKGIFWKRKEPVL